MEDDVCMSLVEALVEANKLDSRQLLKFDPRVFLFIPVNLYNQFLKGSFDSFVFKAINCGNLAAVKHLVPKPIDKQYLNKLLFWAVEANRPEIMDYFLRGEKQPLIFTTSVNITQSTSEEHNIFSYACSCKSYDVIRFLMHKCDIDVQQQCIKISCQLDAPAAPPPTISYISPFESAVTTGNIDLVILLLTNYDAHEKLDLIHSKNNTKLIDVACKSGKSYLVKELLPKRELVTEARLSELKAKSRLTVKRYLDLLSKDDYTDKLLVEVSEIGKSTQVIESQKHELLKPREQLDTPEQDKQQTIFYKKAHFRTAVVEGDFNEVLRWIEAGVSPRGFGYQQLNSWINKVVEQSQWHIFILLFSQLDAKEQCSLLNSESFLTCIVKSEENISGCKTLLVSEQVNLTEQQKHTLVFNLLKLSLTQNNKDKAENLVALINDLEFSEDMEPLISTHLKTMALEGDAIQQLTVETTSCLLALMSSEDQKIVLTSPEFLLKVLLQENGTNIHPFISCLEQLKFDSSFTHDLQITIKQLIVEHGLAQPEAETQL